MATPDILRARAHLTASGLSMWAMWPILVSMTSSRFRRGFAPGRYWRHRDPRGGRRSSRGLRPLPENGKLQVNLVQRWLDDALRVETERAVELDQWHHVMMTYDGSRWRRHQGLYRWRAAKVEDQSRRFESIIREQGAIAHRCGRGCPRNRFRGDMRDARIYNVALTPT